MPNFKATRNAAGSATTGANYKYNGKAEGAKPEYDNMMWALMVSSKDLVSYPKEGVPIAGAYTGFMEWAKSGGAKVGDWYMQSANEDKIFI